MICPLCNLPMFHRVSECGVRYDSLRVLPPSIDEVCDRCYCILLDAHGMPDTYKERLAEELDLDRSCIRASRLAT